MNCSITLRFNKLDQNKNPYQIVLDGISEDSIQDYLNDYSKLLALVKAQGKLEEFLDYSTITGTKGSIYTSKDMEGLKDTNNFFAPNITYDKLRKKYGWLPELTPDEKANMNILFVKKLVINGVPAPYVFQTKDLMVILFMQFSLKVYQIFLDLLLNIRLLLILILKNRVYQKL